MYALLPLPTVFPAVSIYFSALGTPAPRPVQLESR
jgi:hypothetical protein